MVCFQHGLAANEKPQFAGCWPVFTHANLAVGITHICAAPEAHINWRPSAGRVKEDYL